MKISAEFLLSGCAAGPALKLDAPLSFWGGFDPATGTILDQHHPQAGEKIGGKILALRESRGSGGTPGGVAEAIRCGSGPLAFVLVKPDVNITTGAMVARQLYNKNVPVVLVQDADFDKMKSGDNLEIVDTGELVIERK